MHYDDIELPCVGEDCPNGGTFVFTGGEQKFLRGLEADGAVARNGKPVFYTEPKRCKDCRKAKRAFFENRDRR